MVEFLPQQLLKKYKKRKYDKDNYEKRKDYFKDYRTARAEHYIELNREKKYYKKRRLTREQKDEINKKRRNGYNKNNKDKIKARNQAKSKIKIPLNFPCVDCNSKQATHRHHKDYNKPLEVVFLCSGCHGKRHQKRFIFPI